MPPGLSSAMTTKRITREILDLQKEDKGEIELGPTEDNLLLWRGSIPGPEGSVYEGGVFNVEITLPNDYPFSAPKVLFKTRIYHMNISDNGNVCIDILKTQWSPALSLFKVMLSLSSLLTDPNPKDPLVPSIATQYGRSRKQHDAMARQWTAMYAQPKPKPVPVPETPVAVAPASSRARGKRKAVAADGDAASGATTTEASSSSSTSTRNEVIVLDSDGEEETEGRRRKKRKTTTTRTRRAAAAEEVIVIED